LRERRHLSDAEICHNAKDENSQHPESFAFFVSGRGADLAREIGDSGHPAGMVCLGFCIDPRQRLNSVILEKRDVSLGLFLGVADDPASNLNVVAKAGKATKTVSNPNRILSTDMSVSSTQPSFFSPPCLSRVSKPAMRTAPRAVRRRAE
jgi:hypothetical protein